MCGVCGIVQLTGPPRQVASSRTVDVMTDAMTHRGPNDRGTFQEDGVALGVRRLSIVDVDGGHQPFSSEDGTVWAIQNGELYNHTSIKADLEARGHSLRTRCDTEILPHLYEEYGDGFAARLRGKFGVAVWDGRRRRLVLARDRLGVKPLYYAIAGDMLVFASELKSVLASGLVDGTLDYEGIDAYLSLGFFPAPRTPLAQVRKLLPGHTLTVENGAVVERSYWTYPAATSARPMRSFDQYAEQLLDELDEAVRLRLMSDVALGAMLSGGLDSSLVVALMAKHADGAVKTFSVGFADDPDGNELAQARAVAQHFGTDHHEVELSMSDAVDVDELVWWLDEPVADLSALGFLALSELAAETVTVALAGQGADEVLGGYRKHRAAAIADLTPRPVARLARLAGGAPGVVGRGARALAAEDPISRLLAMSGAMSPDLRRSLRRGPLALVEEDVADSVMRQHLPASQRHALRDTLHLDAQLWLVDDMLHYFDRVSMARSLEVRVPFLDHRVVEFCATVPSEFKVRRLETKSLLRRAARGVVPDAVIDRKKVSFFHGAIPRWLELQASASLGDYLLDAEPRSAEFLDRDQVRNIVLRPNRSPAHAKLLLSILVLEVWLSSFLPRAMSASEAPAGVALSA